MKKYYGPIILAVALLLVPYAATHADAAQDKCGIGVSPQFSGVFGVQICSANDLLISIARILLSVLAMIAVLFIIYGGFQYVTSAGNQEQAEKGRSTVVYAIIGLIIAILAYTLVSIVNNSIKGLGSSGGASNSTATSTQSGSQQLPDQQAALTRITNNTVLRQDPGYTKGTASYTLTSEGAITDIAAAGKCLNSKSSTFYASAGVDITHNTVSSDGSSNQSTDHIDFQPVALTLDNANDHFSVILHGTSPEPAILSGETDSSISIYMPIQGNAHDCNINIMTNTTGSAIGG